MLPAGQGTAIDYDEVSYQITLMEKIADGIESARSMLEGAVAAQDGEAWTSEGAPSRLRRELAQAGHYRRAALDDIQQLLRDAAENMRQTIIDFQNQDVARAQRYLAAINGVLAGMPSQPAQTAAQVPEPGDAAPADDDAPTYVH